MDGIVAGRLNQPTPDWPKTLDEAVDRVLAVLTDTDVEAIRATPVADLELLHFSLGVTIRNECGLWSGNVDLLACCGAPDTHPDAASMVIVRAVWEKLRMQD